LKNGQKLFTSAALIVIRQRRRRRLRRESREWVQKSLLDWECYGAVTNLIDTVERRCFPRISANKYMITPLIQRQDTMTRETIRPRPITECSMAH